MRSTCSSRLALVFAATLAAALTIGCATSTSSPTGATGGSLGATAGTFRGKVHGGNQPVVGATVTLWAAGAPTTGGAYGTGATSIKTATSASDGSFTFDTAGVSPCTIGQYLYVTAVGGNTGAGTNTRSAMMAALPNPCSVTVGSTTGSLYVLVNEVTTVAAVSALQQFMSITPGGTPAWQIGAPSSNRTGLANAFLMTSNLATIANGTSNVGTLTNTVGGTSYTTTVTPDSAKIYTMANILAYCVNSTGSLCTSLFTDTTPSGSTAPTDTIQVAYYLATNAGGLTMPTYSGIYGSPYYLCTTYVTASPPFPNGLTCTTSSYPTDWMIGVKLQAVNNTTSATVGTVAAGSLAIDASGNVWTAYDASTGTGSVVEMNVLGQVVMVPSSTATVSPIQGSFAAGWTGGTAYTLGATRTNALAIDTNGNIWYADYYGTPGTDTLNPYGSLGLGLETPIAEISPIGTVTGIPVGTSPNALVIDGSNNLYFQNSPNNYTGSTTARDYVSELSSAAPAYTNYYPGAGRGTTIFNYATVDDTANQNADFFSNTCGSILQVNNASETALGNTALPTTNVDGTVVVTLATTTANGPITCAYNGAPDPAGNLWATNSTAANPYLEYVNIVAGSVSGTAPAAITNTPVVTQFAAGTGLTQGGLSLPKGVAIDGLGHVWVVNGVSSTAGGVSEFTVNTTSSTPTVTPMSPAGSAATMAVYGFGSAYGYNSPLQPVIDGSGNVWITTSAGNYLNLLVGGAAPVVTPYASQIAKTAIGSRP